MKKSIFIAIAMAGIFTGFTTTTTAAVGHSLPASIAPAFNSRYPQAKIKNWKMIGDRCRIEFRDNRNKCAAYYSTNGRWIKTEISIPWTKDLPPAVRTALQKDGYASWYVDGIKEVQTPGEPLYVLHIDNGPSLDAKHYDAFKKDMIVSFTQDGVLRESQSI